MIIVQHKIYESNKLSPFLPLTGHYEECAFTSCFMQELILTGQFRRCSFLNADLTGAKITGAIFIGCNFTRTRFKEVTFRKCRFIDCQFNNASFEKAKGLTTCFFGAGSTYLFSAKGIEPTYDIEGVCYKVEPATIVVKPKRKEQKTVERKKLPEVEHYRSAPSLEAEAAENSHTYSYLDEDEWEQAWCCGYGGWGDYGESKTLGYGSNAVLECPDINEYKECF